MNYYDQIFAIASPAVQSFRTDFDIDRKMLDGYTGRFIYAYRDSGTHLVKLDPVLKAVNELAKGNDIGEFTAKGIKLVMDNTNPHKVMEGILDFYSIFIYQEWKYLGYAYGQAGKVEKVNSKDGLAIRIRPFMVELGDALIRARLVYSKLDELYRTRLEKEYKERLEKQLA